MPFLVKAHSSEESWEVRVGIPGPTLLEVLKQNEIPIKSSCMGKGICHQCRVKVQSGVTQVSSADRKTFSENQLKEGWRLSCTTRPRTNLGISIPQTYKYTNDFEKNREPAGPWWIAWDLGTTGLEMAAVDQQGVWANLKALNRQVIFGADVMTRLESAQKKGVEVLNKKIVSQQKKMVQQFVEAGMGFEFTGKGFVAGNSAVTSFLASFKIDQLAVSPYQPETLESVVIKTDDMQWESLPLIDSFVGGDLTAGLFYLWQNQNGELGSKSWVLIDVGTNSEMLFWDGQRLFVSSTPAGPAFEGSNISVGMRAESGAIFNPVYDVDAERWRFKVIHDDVPKGVCGSALIDVISQLVKYNFVKEDGEVLDLSKLSLTEDIGLNQDDIREFQLAKSAIRTGLDLVIKEGTLPPEKLIIAGNFGNHLDVDHCVELGMFPRGLPAENAGNLCLKGVIAWGQAEESERREFLSWLDRVKRPIELALRDDFQAQFIKYMNLDMCEE